jgi:hypothetical protein
VSGTVTDVGAGELKEDGVRMTVIKVAAGLAVLGALGVLFVRSAQNVTSEPYEVERGQLTGWTLETTASPAGAGAVLVLRPQRELEAALFNQVFRRSGESLSGPAPAEMPLVLQVEFERAVAGTLTPEALLIVARDTGLGSSAIQPRCMALRRVSEPGIHRQVFFLRFDLPAFTEFRRRVAQQVHGTGGHAATFDPDALSPVMIVAASDGGFSSWLPLRSEGADDCLAPIKAH